MLIMPQPLAAMSLKMTDARVITRFGYRRVLISNTSFIGLLIALFATIGPGTPVWLIVPPGVLLRVLLVAAVHRA